MPRGYMPIEEPDIVIHPMNGGQGYLYHAVDEELDASYVCYPGEKTRQECVDQYEFYLNHNIKVEKKIFRKKDVIREDGDDESPSGAIRTPTGNYKIQDAEIDY